jgi:myo-inositol-1(or 4)-monophosphatase
MEPMANLALRAARLAAKHIARAYDRPDLIKISEKGQNDFVTNVDREAERIIIDSLRAKFPDHIFTGEESTDAPDDDKVSDFEWVIDPIDGTTNFVHGLPHFCVSIACLFKGKLEHGVIVDPIRQEEFVASRGKGCSVNGTRTRVRNTKDFDGALISTGGGGMHEVAEGQSNIYKHLMEHHAIIRQPGSAALDLAYIACGRLDAMWMKDLKLWDMAAGALMVMESGGLLGDFSAGGSHLKSGNIVAGGPKVFKVLTPLVRKHLGTVDKGPA